MSVKFLSPIQVSLSLHLSFVLVAGLIYVSRFFNLGTSQIVPLTVIEEPVIIPPNLVLQPPKEAALPKAQLKPETRQVFGASRKSMTAAASDESAIDIKRGNTVAKEQDDLKLTADDADSLPIPADDYLVTQNVKLIFSPKTKRTEEAQKEGYTGVAELSILVDKEGFVRQVELLNNLKFGLNERAVEIAKQLRFQPAQIKGEPVAIKMRFNIVFKAGN